MKFNHYLIYKCLAVVFFHLSLINGTNAQNQNQRHPLVLNIMIEGLTGEDLTAVEPLLSNGGIKKLMQQSLTFSNIYFGPEVDALAAASIVQTGSTPSINGVPSSLIFNPSTNQATATFTNPTVMGNFTAQTYSPSALKVSTIADELSVATDGDSRIYSIAADAQMAITGAGHTANGAFWIDPTTGNWASSTYYRDMPSSVSSINYRTPLKSRLDTIRWAPLLPVAQYPGLSRSERAKSFRYTYPAKDPDRYYHLINSAPANRLITDLTIALLNDQQLGRRSTTDMLAITYKAIPYSNGNLERLDMLIRLDRDVERLLNASTNALHGTQPLVILTSLPTEQYTPVDDKKFRIPTGEFSVKRAISLLNMYLIAIHGNGDWVTGYHNRHFYLNRKLIADRGLNLADFRTEVAEFLSRMSGVASVYTIDDVIASRVGDNPQALKRNISVNHSGDVIIKISPGWQVADSNNIPTGVLRSNPGLLPTFISSPSIKHQTINSQLDARILAPTLSHILQIRYPNASSLPPLIP